MASDGSDGPALGLLDRNALRRSGSSAQAIAAHYDLPAGFFATWLGPELIYSCAYWEDDPGQDLAAAQLAKIDHVAESVDVRGKRVLDVGCGWGGLVERFAVHHGAREVRPADQLHRDVVVPVAVDLDPDDAAAEAEGDEALLGSL